jgi:predicted restriction endonuclease
MFTLFKSNYGYEYAKLNRYKINNKNIKEEIKKPFDESGKKYFEEESDIEEIKKDKLLDETERDTLIKARRGQGEFREGVKSLYEHCIVTGIKDKSLLIASHIIPWKESDNKKRVDKYNGLLLSPHIDKLFDRHLISFTDDGQIYVKDENIKQILRTWSIDISKKYIKFTDMTKNYLKEHRKKVDEKI